jgi:hypothetical protein
MTNDERKNLSDEQVQMEIQVAIDELVRSGTEIGLQVAVIQHGRSVVDAVSVWPIPAPARRAQR